MDILIALLSGTGIFNSLFFIIYLLFFAQQKGTRSSKRILALLIFVVSIKMSYLWAMQLTVDYPTAQAIYFRMAIVSYLSIAPIFYLYIKSIIKDRIDRIDGLHLLPVIVVLVLFNYNTYVAINGLLYIQIYFLIYTILAGFLISKLSKMPDLTGPHMIKWLIALNGMILIVWIMAINQFYKIELLALYAMLLYPTMLFAGDLKYLKEQRNRKSNSNETSEDKDQMERIIKYMEVEKPFLNAQFSMPELAKKMKVSLHIISYLINKEQQKNFSEFVNDFRTNAAAEKLRDNAFDHLTISSIAYEVGFNSLSTFNKAFKKKYNQTPSQFKKQILASVD